MDPGMENFKRFSIHPNKTHIPVSQHINTLYVLNEVIINSSNDGNMKKTLNLTLNAFTHSHGWRLLLIVKIKSLHSHLVIRYNASCHTV